MTCKMLEIREGYCMPLLKEKWDRDLRIIGETVVGSIEKLERGDWHAYGCMSDWQDVDLGQHKSERAAKRAVQQWVEENSWRGSRSAVRCRACMHDKCRAHCDFCEHMGRVIE